MWFATKTPPGESLVLVVAGAFGQSLGQLDEHVGREQA
jgi:hypothetical protein